MALNMTLTATTNTITATVSGLDPAYEGYRTFKFFVDNTPKATERVEGGEASYTKTLSNIYFDSLHAVRCEIWNADASTLFATLNGTVRTGTITMSYWDWTRSNGTATALQTAAAHTALTQAKVSGMRGKTSDFNYRVWSDLTNKLYALITGIGLPWDGEHNTVASRDELTAADMNTLVKNCNYPIWTWRDNPSHEGYLGRLAFRGVHQYGKSGDYVYGHYIIELARVLNVLISVYTDTNTIHAEADTAISIEDYARAKKPRSANANTETVLSLITEAALELKRRGDLMAALELLIAADALLAADATEHMASGTDMRIAVGGELNAPNAMKAKADTALTLTPMANARTDADEHLHATLSLAIVTAAKLEAKRRGEMDTETALAIITEAQVAVSDPQRVKAIAEMHITHRADGSIDAPYDTDAETALVLVTTATLSLGAREWELPYYVEPDKLHIPQSKQTTQTGTRLHIT